MYFIKKAIRTNIKVNRNIINFTW